MALIAFFTVTDNQYALGCSELLDLLPKFETAYQRISAKKMATILSKHWAELPAAIVLELFADSTEVLAALKTGQQHLDFPAAVIVGPNDAAMAVAAIKAGASDFLVQQQSTSQRLVETLQTAIATREHRRQERLTTQATESTIESLPSLSSVPPTPAPKSAETWQLVVDNSFQPALSPQLAFSASDRQALLQSNELGIFYENEVGQILTANDKLLELLQYTPADLQAGQLQQDTITLPEDQAVQRAKRAEVRAKGVCLPYERTLLCRDGQRVTVWVGHLLTGDRPTEILTFVLNWSDCEVTQTALRCSEDRLRLAMASGQLGTWDWNFLTNELSWDSRCKAMFSVPADAAVTIETFFTALHPDEHDRLKQIMQESLVPANGGNYEAEYRIIGIEDRVERWISAKGQAYFTPNGTPQRFIGTVLDITQRKQAEVRLRESTDRLEMAIEGSGGGLWYWNVVTNDDYFSPEWVRMLDYELGELLPEYRSWEQLIHPADKSMVMERLTAHLNDSRNPYRFEYRMRTKSGDWKWIANYGKVVKRDRQGNPLQMAGIHFDINDRKQTEEQLRLIENRYQTLANAVAQLMWVNDAAGNVELFNQQWKHYTGITNLQLNFQTWREIIHPQDFPVIHAQRTAAMKSLLAYEVELRLKRHDQTYRWHIARVIPHKDEHGQILNWFGTAIDIHDSKCAEAEREQLLEQEQAARAAAERANRVKDEFLAILSHELRSPLSPILGWAQLMRIKNLDTEKLAQAVETIERNAKLQSNLIDDLLDVAKILRGKLQLDSRPVFLATTIRAAIETVKTAALAKEIVLEVELQDAGQIRGDATRIQQIVWNLLSNAIKFTPPRGQVSIQLTQVENHGKIAVTDTGKGIKQEFLPFIFESFRQEDVSINRQHGGLGLGLAIVKYLVEAHGGEVTATSPGEGQGSTFTVTLPLMPSGEADDRGTGISVEELSLAGLRILAVDDDPDIQDLIFAILSQHDAEVITVGSAKEALSKYAKCQPDLLLSDLGMPQVDGFSLLRQIRSLSAANSQYIPAIALSAYAREEDRLKALSCGFQKHVAKPIDVDVLLQAIAEVCRARQ